MGKTLKSSETIRPIASTLYIEYVEMSSDPPTEVFLIKPLRVQTGWAQGAMPSNDY